LSVIGGLVAIAMAFGGQQTLTLTVAADGSTWISKADS
jgi:hypothetical protein